MFNTKRKVILTQTNHGAKINLETIRRRVVDQPSPESSGKCSRDCPKFYYETTHGWPPNQACYVWDEKLDGEEPYYLTDSICRPAIRLMGALN